MWRPVRIDVLERAAAELRRRRGAAVVQEAGIGVAGAGGLTEADLRLGSFLAIPEWHHLLDLAANIRGTAVETLALPSIWVDRATGAADWAWDLRRSRGRAEVLVEIGPVIRIIKISHSKLGRATRALAVGRGLHEAAGALAPHDRAVGLPALERAASATVDGTLADLLREALWWDARRRLGLL